MIRRNTQCTLIGLILAMLPVPASAEPLEIVKESGIKGGLAVHVGCGDGTATARLRINDNLLIQGLTTSDTDMDAARGMLLEKGLHGPISVIAWDGGVLPYNDNLVNLLLVEEDVTVSEQELLRVLIPGGTAHIKQGNTWKQITKEIPSDQDVWTHSLYDATGNAVSQDMRVGPPRHLQWFGGPRFGRQHEQYEQFYFDGVRRWPHFLYHRQRIARFDSPAFQMVPRRQGRL